MRSLLFVFISLAVLACSKEKPAPIAPTGKAVASAGAPVAPTNLRVEAITDTSARIAWDAVADATDYDVNYRTLSGRWTNEPHRGARPWNVIDDLEPDTEYRWAVRAENSDGPSSWVFGENFQTHARADSFNIEVVYLGSFSQEQKRWIGEIAQQWEMFFYGVEDVSFNASQTLSPAGVSIPIVAGDVIDDIRIYVSGFSPAMQNLPDVGWTGGTTLGLASPLLYRDSGIPLVALIAINKSGIEDLLRQSSLYRNQKDHYRQMYWRDTFHHELGHAFGIGQAAGWLDNIYWHDINNPFFAGANAKAQMQQIAVLMPEYPNLYDPRGILLEKRSFGSGEPPIHFLWLGRGSFRQYYLHENGAPNVTRVTLGAFEDIGWPINYEPAYPKLVFSSTLRCWDDTGNFRLCE